MEDKLGISCPGHNNGRGSSHTQLWGAKWPWGDPPESIFVRGLAPGVFHTTCYFLRMHSLVRDCPNQEESQSLPQNEGISLEEITQTGRNHLDRILKAVPDWSLKKTCKRYKNIQTKLKVSHVTARQSRIPAPSIYSSGSFSQRGHTFLVPVSISYFKYPWEENLSIHDLSHEQRGPTSTAQPTSDCILISLIFTLGDNPPPPTGWPRVWGPAWQRHCWSQSFSCSMHINSLLWQPPVLLYVLILGNRDQKRNVGWSG